MRKIAFLLTTAVFFAYCGSDIQNPGRTIDTGSVNITASFPAQKYTQSDSTRVKITVSGDFISPDIEQDLVQVGSNWSGIIGKIPVGTNRTFTAEAFDASDTLIFYGQATGIDITPDSVQTVLISLLEQAPAQVPGNAYPVIEFLTISDNSVAPDSTVSLFVQANDPDGDPISFSWSAGNGSFGSQSDTANSSSVDWQAPSVSGLQTITIEVEDDQLGLNALSFDIDVQTYYATGTAVIDLEFLALPLVTGLTASPAQLYPGNNTTQLDVGVSAANPVTFLWSKSGCGSGSFDDATLQSPAYTANNSALTSPASCEFTVAITDTVTGGVTQQSITIARGPNPFNGGPNIFATFQSVQSVGDGDQVVFRVVAEDPEGEPLTFSYAASDGSFATATDTATTSEVVYTAPACSDNPITVSVTVTDSPYGLTAVHNYLPLVHDNVCVVSPLNENPGANASLPDILVDGNTKYVAWLEDYTFAYVKRKVGNGPWQLLGSQVNTPGQNASSFIPELTWFNGELYVTYGQRDITDTYTESVVKKWDGTNWVQVGGSLTDSFYSGGASIAEISGELWAVILYTDGTRIVQVRRFDGTNWVQVGNNLYNNNALINNPLRIIEYNGAAHAFYSQQGNLNLNVWDGSTWNQQFLTSSFVPATVLVNSGELWISGNANTAPSGFSSVRIRSWDGTNFTNRGDGFQFVNGSNETFFGTLSVDSAGDIFLIFGESVAGLNVVDQIFMRQFYSGSTWPLVGTGPILTDSYSMSAVMEFEGMIPWVAYTKYNGSNRELFVETQ